MMGENNGIWEMNTLIVLIEGLLIFMRCDLMSKVWLNCSSDEDKTGQTEKRKKTTKM